MPEEPFDDRMIPPPVDPWATINRPAPTVHLNGADLDQTARITPTPPPTRATHGDPAASRDGAAHVDPAGARGGGAHVDPAGHPGDPNQTVYFAPAEPTTRDPRSAPTVRQPRPTWHDQGSQVGWHDQGPQQGWRDQGSPAGWHEQQAQPEAGHGYPPGPAPGSQSAPTVGAEAELRFGPGVPPAPAAAPDWPAAAPAGRPLWRRLVSVLSTLLTIVLVAVVGLYLWQRLRPLELEGVTVAVPQPAGERCDVTVDVVATVRTNGRSGVIRYQWFRSDAPPGDVLTEQVGRGRSTATLTLRWTFSGVGSTTETATVNIIEPTAIRSGAEVAYRCTG